MPETASWSSTSSEGVDEDDEFIPDDDDEEGDNESAEDDDVVWVSANRSVERVNDQATSAEVSCATPSKKKKIIIILKNVFQLVYFKIGTLLEIFHT